MIRHALTWVGLLCTGALTAGCLTACSSSTASPAGLQILASTDVYGSIASAIAGDHAQVTSLIDDPDQDPHSYEASARNQLAVSKADVIVENGGGYDDFLDRMRSASAQPGVTVIDVVQLSGRTAAQGGELNEHVWYDFGAVAALVHRLVTVLSKAEPGAAASFAANARTFDAALARLVATEHRIRARDHGAGVAITEPVPLYLLQACGLVNRTPSAFSESVEAGTDVSAAVLSDTLALFSGQRVRALVYNEQTTGPETTQVLEAAKAASIPVVPVTETLPAGDTYLSWMRANLAALDAALSR